MTMRNHLVFSTVNLFLVQLVLASDKICTTTLECGKSDHSSWSWSSNKNVGVEKVVGKNELKILESGLEFLTEDHDYHPIIDEGLYFGDSKTNLSELKLVQAFIRNLKGLLPLRSDDPDSPILPAPNQSESDVKRPDWVFFPYQLKTLVENEVKIYQILKNYSKSPECPKPFPALKSYLMDLERSTMKALHFANSSDVPKNPDTLLDTDPYLYIASHPLLIYRMIRRFAEELPSILKTIMTSNIEGSKFIEEMLTLFPDFKIFPGHSDFQDALQSLWRVQYFADLKTTDFARGKLERIETMLGVNALQALEIGVYHLNLSHYDYAIEWLHLALESVKEDKTVQKYPIIQTFFENRLTAAIERHNEKWVNESKDKTYPKVFNTTVTLPFDPSAYVRLFHAMDEELYRGRHNTTDIAKIRLNFIRTCAGKNFQTEKEKAALTCWYEQSKHPYWLINPQKTELLNKNPDLFQIYDFIGDNLIEKMKEDAKNRLFRSHVVDRNNHTRIRVDPVRTSTQAWVWDTRPPGAYLNQLTRRLELLTGLVIYSENAGEAYQVALYGPSQHYDYHTDAFEDPRRCAFMGNRILTIMGYLSDVEVGGKTGFPIMGVAASPRKGSLVIWENLRFDKSTRDMRTYHGGCPCVLGLKWITNKWIRTHENMFVRQCPTEW